MFIDPNFETLSGEFLARDMWRAASSAAPGAEDGADTDWLRRFWRRAVRVMTGVPREDQGRGGAAH
jgi:hypothetical protein